MGLHPTTYNKTMIHALSTQNLLLTVGGDDKRYGCDCSCGYNYDTAVELTGGTFLSICGEDWG